VLTVIILYKFIGRLGQSEGQREHSVDFNDSSVDNLLFTTLSRSQHVKVARPLSPAQKVYNKNPWSTIGVLTVRLQAAFSRSVNMPRCLASVARLAVKLSVVLARGYACLIPFVHITQFYYVLLYALE